LIQLHILKIKINKKEIQKHYKKKRLSKIINTQKKVVKEKKHTK